MERKEVRKCWRGGERKGKEETKKDGGSVWSEAAGKGKEELSEGASERGIERGTILAPVAVKGPAGA